MANAPPMKRFLKLLASVAKTPTQAIILTTVVSAIACWFNWGFGLIVGALIAKEIAKSGLKVDYPLLIAAAYIGFLSWHGGMSGSVPLTIAAAPAAGQPVANTGGALMRAVPLNETIFTWWNWLIQIGLLLVMPFVNAAMHPKGDDIKLINPELLREQEDVIPTPTTPAEKLENSHIIQYIGIVLIVVYLGRRIMSGRYVLDINGVNMIFLCLGMILWGKPILYANAIVKAAKGAGPILLQFPFYAGIQGMMVGATAVAAGGTGLSLSAVIVSAFISISTRETFPYLNWVISSIVNMFIPSGGGQWAAVQGPITMPTAVALGVDPGLAAMSYCWGDSWTNMIQPFWALPALGVAGLGARNIMGYTLMALIVSGFIIGGGMLLAGFLT